MFGGHGFSIGNRLFLTAGHNVTDFNIKKSYIVFGNDKEKKYKISKLIYCNRSNDIAILKLKSNPVYSLKLSMEDPACGTEILIPHYKVNINNYNDIQPQISKGIVTNMDFGFMYGTTDRSTIYEGESEQDIRLNFHQDTIGSIAMYEKNDVFRHTCPTTGGFSGCPVILKGSNKVIGIHIEGDQWTQDFHTALKINTIKAELDTYLNSNRSISKKCCYIM